MKYLALSIMFLLPSVSFAATVDEQKTAIIQQLIVLIEQELDYLMSIQAGTPTGNAVDNTATITQLTNQLTTPTMQPEVIVHDDTKHYDQFKDQPNMKCYNVFLKDGNGNFISGNEPVEFYVGGVLITTYHPTGKQSFDMDNVESPAQPGVGAFCHEINEGQTLTIKALGQVIDTSPLIA